jgi:hypothetical protein
MFPTYQDKFMKLPIYPPPLDQMLTLGEPAFDDDLDYLSLGLTQDHIPDLIRMLEEMQEIRLSSSLHLEEIETEDEDEIAFFWAPIHAWRALGQLKAEEAIPALLGQLHHVDDNDDEWFMEEADDILVQIGPAAVEPLREYIENTQHGLYARITAVETLEKLGNQYPEVHERCKAILIGILEGYAGHHETMNGFLIDALIGLKAVEATPLVEQIFKAGQVDALLYADFEDYQEDMGLIPPREKPQIRNFPHMAPASTLKAEGKAAKESKKEKSKRKQEKKSRKKNRKK